MGVLIEVLDYDEKSCREKKVKAPEEVLPYLKSPTVSWINLVAPEPETIRKLASLLGFHPLTVRNLLNPSARAKFENLGGQLFFTGRMLYLRQGTLQQERVSLVLGKGFVLTVQEKPGDVFDPVREKLREGTDDLRKKGGDFLAYCLLEAVVSGYFEVLEKLGEEVEELEDELVKFPSQRVFHRIHRLRKKLLMVRRATWPLREVFPHAERLSSPLVGEETRAYFRELQSNVLQVIETVEMYREMLSSAVDIYLSSLNNRMNEIMKVLTIIATIFLPLSFITGIYGMNFVYMPELSWKWSYFAVLGAMVAIAVLLLIYFKKKRWL